MISAFAAVAILFGVWLVAAFVIISREDNRRNK
jgi:hypothetical protein